MFNRNTISAMVGGMALGAGVSVAMMAHAQDDTRPVAVAAPTLPMKPLAPEAQQLHVTALATDTFVTVKDHGDSQTISVFRLDAKGVNHLQHKAKFFY